MWTELGIYMKGKEDSKTSGERIEQRICKCLGLGWPRSMEDRRCHNLPPAVRPL